MISVVRTQRAYKFYGVITILPVTQRASDTLLSRYRVLSNHLDRRYQAIDLREKAI